MHAEDKAPEDKARLVLVTMTCSMEFIARITSRLDLYPMENIVKT